ncbi:response regulator [Oceaniglobus trochenteri]|uniref:response regulator n=1 Tax=Oceaniglobus trochenteri TaxID=2763260 RepID=UPI001D001853|nr:response regulator [Oceaniglobus trochenteri]
MHVLIVEENPALAEVWAGYLRRSGAQVSITACQQDAIAFLQGYGPDIVILDLGLRAGSPLAIADYASYRHPQIRIIPVTRDSFFSDGSVFVHVPNTCTVLAPGTPPEDMAAIVAHYGTDGPV